MDTKALRQKILDLAIRGKLVPQDPNDEPASVLLERIRAEKSASLPKAKSNAPKSPRHLPLSPIIRTSPRRLKFMIVGNG